MFSRNKAVSQCTCRYRMTGRIATPFVDILPTYRARAATLLEYAGQAHSFNITVDRYMFVTTATRSICYSSQSLSANGGSLLGLLRRWRMGTLSRHETEIPGAAPACLRINNAALPGRLHHARVLLQQASVCLLRIPIPRSIGRKQEVHLF